ncbi:MAG: SHOCT domain-containing protein [Clostridia bacterium]|nr:SHOCT domain-containing protein [Clostridia bacterium]
MFSNIGGKIKTVAAIVAWVGIIASVVSGFICIAVDDDLILVGLLIAVVGSLISWVSSFVLYGYGQLIQNTDKMVGNVYNDKQPMGGYQTGMPVNNAPVNNAPVNNAPAVDPRFESLKRLREQGVITDEEFQQKMAEIWENKNA